MPLKLVPQAHNSSVLHFPTFKGDLYDEFILTSEVTGMLNKEFKLLEAQNVYWKIRNTYSLAKPKSDFVLLASSNFAWPFFSEFWSKKEEF